MQLRRSVEELYLRLRKNVQKYFLNQLNWPPVSRVIAVTCHVSWSNVSFVCRTPPISLTTVWSLLFFLNTLPPRAFAKQDRRGAEQERVRGIVRQTYSYLNFRWEDLCQSIQLQNVPLFSYFSLEGLEGTVEDVTRETWNWRLDWVQCCSVFGVFWSTWLLEKYLDRSGIVMNDSSSSRKLAMFRYATSLLSRKDGGNGALVGKSSSPNAETQNRSRTVVFLKKRAATAVEATPLLTGAAGFPKLETTVPVHASPMRQSFVPQPRAAREVPLCPYQYLYYLLLLEYTSDSSFPLIDPTKKLNSAAMQFGGRWQWGRRRRRRRKE